MAFSWKIWVLTITLRLVDVDPTDKTIGIGLEISWA